MILPTDMAGLAGNALALAAVAAWLGTAAGLPWLYRAVLCGAVFAGLLVPFGSLPAAAYVRGAVGDLSVTTVSLAFLFLAGNLAGWRPFDAANRLAVQMLVVLAALWLYPMALGLGYFDPYRAGYGDPWFLGVLLAVALVLLYRRHSLAALLISAAVLAWAGGWYESANLWDYLLDPLVALCAAGAFIRRGAILLLSFRKMS